MIIVTPSFSKSSLFRGDRDVPSDVPQDREPKLYAKVNAQLDEKQMVWWQEPIGLLLVVNFFLNFQYRNKWLNRSRYSWLARYVIIILNPKSQ